MAKRFEMEDNSSHLEGVGALFKGSVKKDEQQKEKKEEALADLDDDKELVNYLFSMERGLQKKLKNMSTNSRKSIKEIILIAIKSHYKIE
ncbi:hypothetical protein [Mucilaginibacter arboris]|uniref:Uncharacterized protein n=1 Tax=Mucilaginibacter arboris TaxID=2682090 RepID=A0A7K1T071_9SPHI|nr:hypothetical protein [Mucilaginibacter arboris]MVN22961.1 hypothetical protein [Mucilaginibacter arboris]